MALRQTEPVKETVGEYNFYITPFPAFKAANLTGELASVLAPIFGAVAPIVGEGDLMDADASKVASAMMNSPAISGDKLEKLMQKLLLGGHIVAEVPNDDGDIEPQRLDMDLANEIFCGEVQDMFILCFHVIKLNFNGFFKKLAAQSGQAKGKAAKKMRKIL